MQRKVEAKALCYNRVFAMNVPLGVGFLICFHHV